MVGWLGSVVWKYSKRVFPASSFGRRLIEARPAPWLMVERSSRSVVHNMAGSCSIRSFSRASLSHSASSASRRSVTSSMVPA